MRIKTKLESQVNSLRLDGKTYSQIAEDLGITHDEVRRLAYKRPNAGVFREKHFLFPDITPKYLEVYKRRIKIGTKVTVKNHLYEVEREGDGITRKKMWITARITAKYPHIVTLDNGHSVTYQELISGERYGKMQEEE